MPFLSLKRLLNVQYKCNLISWEGRSLSLQCRSICRLSLAYVYLPSNWIGPQKIFTKLFCAPRSTSWVLAREPGGGNLLQATFSSDPKADPGDKKHHSVDHVLQGDSPWVESRNVIETAFVELTNGITTSDGLRQSATPEQYSTLHLRLS